jgi:cyclophilin family peptidyl-prolyl cis-trans isomerase
VHAPPANPTPDASSIAANSPPPAPTKSIALTPPPESAPPPVPVSTPASSGTESSKSPPPSSPSNPEVASTSETSAEDPSAQEQVVVVRTSFGSIVIELDDDAAPKTCDNFRRLVSDGFYDHTVFHRVIPNFIIQGGDPNSIASDRASYGNGGPTYKLPAEINLKHVAGAVAMARLPDSVNPQRESNGSQFYICLVACPSLDDKYTVFGRVIKGLEVAEKISSQPRDSRDNPLSRIEMEATLESKAKALASDTSNP